MLPINADLRNPTPTPSGRVKKEKVIKKEDNGKEEPLTPGKRSRAISSTTEIARATRRETRNRHQVTDDDDELPLDALPLLRRTGARGKEVGKAGQDKDGESEDTGGEDGEAKGSDDDVPTPLA